jgi:chromosome segregation ATPase
MLHLVRSELKAEMKSGFSRMDAKFDLIDSRFLQIDSRFSQIDSRFSQIDAKFGEISGGFQQMNAKLEQVISESARIAMLVEEQNSRNQIVLEGLTGLWQRQERIEERVEALEKRPIPRSRT